MIYSRAVFRSTALVPTSRRDFYQILSQAVVSGRLGSSDEELLNSLRKVSPDENERPVWESEPLMGHFVRNADEARPDVSNSSKVPLKTQLAQAINRGQIYDIIHDALLPKLYSLFQMDPVKVQKNTITTMRLDDLGIDSLLAVEVRGWFLKTLEVNIPVLKILSGLLANNLISMATQEIPKWLTPGLQQDSGYDESGGTVRSDISQELFGELTTDDDSPSVSQFSGPSKPSTDALSISSQGECVLAQIAKPDLQNTLRLSFSQEMFWFIWVYLRDKTSLNHTAWARVSGEINIPNLKRAIQTLGQQHEILRTCIRGE